MNKLFKNKAFNSGFFAGILIIIVLNFYSIFGMKHPPCHHCADWFGFPFPFYEKYVTNCDFPSGISFRCYVGEFSWIGTVVNILIAIIFSFIVGLIFKFVWSKAASQKLR